MAKNVASPYISDMLTFRCVHFASQLRCLFKGFDERGISIYYFVIQISGVILQTYFLK